VYAINVKMSENDKNKYFSKIKNKISKIIDSVNKKFLSEDILKL
tara:strand:+ start:9522 stop:9653 length:132 start_codon:yes stop_codon:yes gene_type:complete